MGGSVENLGVAVIDIDVDIVIDMDMDMDQVIEPRVCGPRGTLMRKPSVPEHLAER